MTESKEKEIEQLDGELEEEQARLKKLQDHGIHMGMVEFNDMQKNHPTLLEFFDKADEALQLDDKGKKRLVYLEQQYLDGAITEDELKELKDVFFNPYFKIKLKQI